MIKIENENLFQESLHQGINLFLGAGFSVEATGTFQGKPKNLPAGDGLRQELLKEFRRDQNSKFKNAAPTTMSDNIINSARKIERFFSLKI